MKNTTPATVNHLTRFLTLGLLGAVLALVALAPSVFAANTADNYTGGVNGSFLTAGNWSLAALPAVTNDATFPVGSASGIRLFSAGSLTNGSFDNLCPSNTLSIRNETTTSTSSTLTLGGAGNLGNASAGANSGDLIYVVSGGTLNIIGPNGSTGSGVLNLVLGQSGNFDVIGSSTISSVISDGGSGYSITKTGAGTLTLSGTNTYTGATTISAGTLAIGGAGQLGGGTYSAAITNNSAFNYNSSAAQTLSGVVSGSGSLTNTGTGTLTLTASNTYTGATIVGGTGILQLQNASAVPSASALTLNSGSTLSLQADADTAFTNASISSFSTSGNKYYIMVNSINAPAGNGHTLTLANASGGTASSGVNVGVTSTTGDTLKFNSAFTLTGSGAGAWASDYLAFNLTNVNLIVTGLSQSSVNGQIVLNSASGNSLTINGAVLANNSRTIGATVNSGVLTLNNTVTRGTGANNGFWVSLNGGTLNLNTNTAINNNRAANNTLGGFTINSGTLDNTSGANVTNTANPNISIGGSFTFQGTTNLNLGTGAVQLFASSTVTVSANTLTIPGIISGGFGLTNAGSGKLLLTGTNTYTGATTVSGGTLQVDGASGAINTSSGVTVNGASAKYLHTASIASTETITETLGAVDGTGTLGTVNVANNSANVVQNGNGGTTTLTIGTLAFSGAATINVAQSGTAGTSGISVTGVLNTTPANGTITVNATVAGGVWTSGTTYNLVHSGSGSLTVGNFTKGTVTGLLARQSASLVQVDANTIGLQIAGDSPKWTGLDSASWVVGSTGASHNWKTITGNTPTDYIEGDIVLFDDSATSSHNSVSISAANVSPTSTTFGNSTVSYTVSSSGGYGIAAGTVSVSGGGTVNLNTTNTYSGSTTISANSTLNLGGSLGSTAISVGAGSTLSESSAGTIGGSASLASSGSTTLAGTNSYSGATTVSAGTLNVSGALGNTAVAVSGTLSLQKGGAVSTNLVTVNSGGSLNETAVNGLSGGVVLTVASGGSATLSSANNYNGATTNSGTLLLSDPNALTNSALTLNSGGTLGLQADADTTFATTSLTMNTGGVNNFLVNALTGAGSGHTLTITNNAGLGNGNTTINVTSTNGDTLKFGSSFGVTANGSSAWGGPETDFNLTNANVILNGMNAADGGMAVSSTTGGSLTVSGGVNNGGSTARTIYAKVNSGTLILTNTYIGGSGGGNWGFFAILNGGTLAINNPNAIIGDGATSGHGSTLATLEIASGILDNTSGTNLTLNNPTVAINVPGNFTFAGTTNLNLGTGTVVLNTNCAVTVSANTLTVGGAISDGGSVYGLTKSGGGTLTLNGANTFTGAVTNNGGTLVLTNANLYTGNTVINGGTLALTGSGAIASTPSITVANGATLDVSGLASTFTLGGGQVLYGGGTVNGSMNTASGAKIYAGGDATGIYATNTFNNNLTNVTGATVYLDLGDAYNGTNDLISVAGNLVLNSTVFHLKAPSTSDSLGANDYVLAQAATVTGSASITFDTAPANAAHYSVQTTPTNVLLHYTSVLLPTVVATVNPATVVRNQSVTVTATVTAGDGTLNNVSVDLSAIGGSSTASLVLSNANVYTNTFTVAASTTPSVSAGDKTLTVTVTDTAPPLTNSTILTLTVNASTEVWNGLATGNTWSSNTNWASTYAPGLAGDSLDFGGSTQTTPNMDASYSVNGVTFDSTAGGFTITNSVNTMTLAGGGVTNNSANLQTLNVPIVLGAAQTFNTASNSITLGGGVSGGGSQSLTKVGTNTLTLASANTYTGNTIINAGALRLLNTNALAGSALTLNSTLQLRADANATFTPASIANISGTTATVDADQVTSGGGNGGKTLTLGGNFTLNASAQLNVTAASGDTLALGTISLNAGGLTESVNAAASTKATVAGVQAYGVFDTFAFAGAGNIDVLGAMNENTSPRWLGLTFNQSGTVTLWAGNNLGLSGNGNVAYTPTVSFNNGLTVLNNSSALSASGGNGVVAYLGASSGSSAVTVLLGGPTTGVEGGITMNPHLFYGTVSVRDTATNTLTLGGQNTSGVNTWGCNFTLGSTANTGKSVTLVAATGGEVDFTGIISTNGTDTTAGITVGNGTYGGTVRLTGVNTYAGGTTVNGGTLALSSALTGTTATGALTNNDGGTLLVTVSGTSQLTPSTLVLGSSAGGTNAFANVGSTTIAPLNPATLTVIGTPVINITSMATLATGTYPLITNYTSGSFVLGTLPAGVGAHLATGGNVVALVVDAITPDVWANAGGGNWDTATATNWKTNGTAKTFADGDLVQFDDTPGGSAISVTNTNPVVSPAGVIVTNSAVEYTIGGNPIAGGASLTKSGNGTLKLTGTNTYTGGTTISAGTLQLGDGLVNNGVVAGNITDNGSLVFANPNAQTNTGVVSGSGTLGKTAGGVLTLSTAQTYTGGTVVSNGTLNLALGGSTGTVRGSLAINSGATVNATVVDALGYGGGVCVTNVSIAGGVLNNGAGGNNGYLANFNLTGGTMSSSGGGAFNFNTGYGISSSASATTSTNSAPVLIRGSGLTFTVAHGTTPSGIDLVNSGAISYGGGGSGGVTKAGSGTLLFAGTNTYTGGTIVSGGTLDIFVGPGGSQFYQVADGATLGIVNLTASGQFVGQPSGVGSLTVGTSAGATLLFSNLDGSSPYGEILAGHFTNNGTCTIKITDTNNLVAGNTYQLVGYGGTYAGAGTFVLSAPPTLAGYVTNDTVNDVLSLVVTSIGVPSQSANAYLTALVLNPNAGFAPGFTTNGYLYYATNSYGQTPTVTVTNADATATNTLIVNGVSLGLLTNSIASAPLTLGVGSTNVVAVRVVSQDLSVTNLYVVDVTLLPPPLSTNAQLTSLALTPAGTLYPAFDTGTLNYDATNTCANNPVTVTVTNADLTATNLLIYNGTTNGLASGATSAALTLVTGANTVTVRVVSQDLSVTNSYVVAVTLAAPPVVTVNSTNIYAGGTATLTATNNASSPTYLWSPGGATTQTITVSPGVTTNYTVLVTDGATGCVGGGSGTVTILPSTNALLASLSLTPAGTLFPTFATNVYSYNATNTYANKTVTVAAGSVNANATLALNFNGGGYGSAVTNSLSISGNTLGLPTNTVAVRVVSQDLSQTNVYTVNVLLQPSATPPKLTNSVSGTTLTLTWPADHLGYRLLVQTNNLNKGVSGNINDWGTVSGTATVTSTNITIIKAGVTNQYYKLVYP